MNIKYGLIYKNLIYLELMENVSIGPKKVCQQ